MNHIHPSVIKDAAMTAASRNFTAIAGEALPENWILRWLATKRSVLSAGVAADLLRAVDCCIVIVTSWVALLLHPPVRTEWWPYYGPVAVLGGVLLVNVMQMQGAYHRDRVRKPLSRLGATGVAVLLTAGVLVIVAFVTNGSARYARSWALLWLALALGAVIAVRLVLSMMLAHLRRSATSCLLQRKVAVLGAGADATRLVDHLEQVDHQGIRIMGVFDASWSATASAGGRSTRGAIDELCRLCRAAQLDTVYVAMPLSAGELLFEALDELRCLPVDIRLVVAPVAYHLLNRRISYLEQLPVIHVADRPLEGWGRLAKRIEDSVLALVALTLLGPLMLLIAIGIRIDSPGPALFRQKRYGFNNQLIEVLKFRTMRHEQCDFAGSVLTSRDDARVTCLGRLLRRTSLDELPQLINVLRGEMSIVGPRPHAVEAKAANRFYQDIVRGYAARHKMKPGITGWAQVNGWRGTTETEDHVRKRFEHDLWYLEHWSIVFDVKIMLLTVLSLLFDDHAY